MIYTTNWIERLQKDFRRVTRMRGAMPNEESVLLLMGKTAMDKKSYRLCHESTWIGDYSPSEDYNTKIRSIRRGVLI